jgi:hypothetical protein
MRHTWLASSILLLCCVEGKLQAAQSGNAPTAFPPGPLTTNFVPFFDSTVRGRAQIVSTPPGIDCPGSCTPGEPLTLAITANSNSIVSSPSSCSQGGSTVQQKLGNTIVCKLFRGGRGNLTVPVSPYPFPRSSAITGSGRNPSHYRRGLADASAISRTR